MRQLSIFSMVILFCIVGLAQVPFQITKNGTAQDLSLSITTALGFDGLQKYQELLYENLSGRDLKAGYSSQAIWLKFKLENTTEKTVERVVYFTSALVGRLELFDQYGTLNQITGGAVPFNQRVIKSRLPSFRILLQPNSVKEFYIQRISHHSLSTRIEIADVQTFLENEYSQKAYFYFYVGGMLCLILFNFLIGLYTTDKGFLYYSMFALTLGSTICVLHGVFDSYFFENFDFVISDYLMCFSALSAMSALIFSHRFLHLYIYLPRARYLFQFIGVLAFLVFMEGALLRTPWHWDKMGYVTDFVVVLTLGSLIGAGFLSLRRGGQMSKFFLISWAFMFLGVMGYFGAQYGILPSTAIFNHGILFGSLIEMVVISLGLAYKLNILDLERRQALESAEEKEHYHRLVKVLSHDVSNAMLIIAGFTFRLQKRLLDSADQSLLIKMNHVIQKMNDILGMVKKEEAFKSFKAAVDLKPVLVHEVVAEVLYFYQDRIDEKMLSVDCKIAESVEVYADRTALAHQVISNIVSNAIKFSKPGQKISIGLKENGQEYRLSFEDQGVGIPSDLIEKIFFSTKAISTEGTLNEKGSGIGSTLIRQYMTLFGGQLEVKSSTEKTSYSEAGTTVILVFPKRNLKSEV